jgi:hypothetical protein
MINTTTDTETVTIDRARLERLLACANASTPFLSYTSVAELADAINSIRDAASSLHPGDLDPLP